MIDWPRMRTLLVTLGFAAAFLVLGCMLVYGAIHGLRTGVLIHGRIGFERAREPVGFWIELAVMAIAAGCCLYAGIQTAREALRPLARRKR